MTSPLLSIIIVNWNTADITVNCLKSIFADKGLKNTPYEIILIDNASTDDSVAKIKKLKGPIKIIVNKKNLGFGQANNQGLKLAQGNYILLLNTDIIILHSAISQSLDWLSSHPEAYGCTAQLLNQNKTIQPSGGYFPTIWNMASLLLHLDDLPLVNQIIPPYHPHSPDFYTRDSYYLHDHPQDWITGAFVLIRREVLTKVGGFEPDFFMYGEEMEMFYRIHQLYPKLQLWYLIGPQVIHLGGASSTSKQIVFDREYDGLELFFQRHRPLWQQKLLTILISTNRFLQLLLNKFLHRA